MSVLLNFDKTAPKAVKGLQPSRVWRVASSSNPEISYSVELYSKDGIDFWACSCRGWTFSGCNDCKHCKIISQRHYAEAAKLVTLRNLDDLAETLKMKTEKARHRHFAFSDIDFIQTKCEELAALVRALDRAGEKE